MPENETILPDARNARRLRPIADRLGKGQSPTEAFPLIQNQFYALLQTAWRQWRSGEIDPAKLFDAVLNDTKAFRELVKQTRNDGNARLLGEVAASLQNANRDVLGATS